MSTWLLQVYLCGGFVTAAGASVVADLLSEPDVPLTTRAVAIVIAATTWPVLLVGVVELFCIRVVGKTVWILSPQRFSRRRRR